MKVLLIDVNCKYSSTGQLVYNLYTYLNGHGNEAAICYGRGEIVREKNIYKFGLDWETNLHALLTRLSGFTGCFSYFSTKRLIHYIEEFKPDVIHIHELHAYFVNIRQLLEYLAKTNIRIVHTLHCEFSYTGKCGHSIECEKWKSECGNCPHLHDYPSTIIFDHTKQMFRTKKNCFQKLHNSAFVAPSKWLYERMNSSFLKNKKTFLIHNSIMTDIFKPIEVDEFRNEIGISEDKKVVLALAPGLMSENKGGKYVLEVAKRIKDVQFLLIGTDEGPFKVDNVRALGKIYDKRLLAKYYSVADVFLICSKNENFPTTCIEAICCGTPVVGFDAGGASEIATGELGVFIEYGNVDLLVESLIERLKLSKDMYKDQFIAAYNHFSLDRMCREYMDVYRG